MNATSEKRPKVLFLLSRDYGELFNADYFIKGSAIEPVVVLPPSLFALNRDALAYRTYEYQRAGDIHPIIESEAPDVVLLFSGYLYVVNQVLQSETAVHSVLDRIRSLGIPMATSDPSLGLLTAPDATVFNDRHPRHQWMVEHFTRTAEVLADLTHLYLAPSALVTKAKHLSYFNPHVVLSPLERENLHARLADGGVLSSKQLWLFVLSQEDVKVQCHILGAKQFIQILGRLLVEACALGRHAMLIAPQNLVTAFQRAELGGDDMSVMSSCSYPNFMDWLLAAEHVFYWNQFSASIVARAANLLPFFVFDKGHLAYAMKPLLPIAMEHFYPGCELDRLDAEESLDAAHLANLAARQVQQTLPKVYENLSGGLAPDEVVMRIRGGC